MTTAPGMMTKVDISVLYHLQTPLDAIKGSTAIALGRTPTPDPAETRRLFHAIGRQADLLNRLIENMIYQAETEAGEQESDGEPEPFVLEELAINYAERRVTVADCPVRLTANEYRLLQELSNNAGWVLPVAGQDFANVVFELQLSNAAGADISIDYQTIDGFAVAGADYQATSGRATIPAGASKTYVKAPVIDDQEFENGRAETFTLRLHNPNHYVLAGNSELRVTGRIFDNEEPPEGEDYVPARLDTVGEISVGKSWLNGNPVMGRIELENVGRHRDGRPGADDDDAEEGKGTRCRCLRRAKRGTPCR